MGLTSCIQSILPFAAMITVECTQVGLSVICKAAMTQGMNNFVSVVYYNALGTLILLPYFLFKRNKCAPLTFTLLQRCFLAAMMGSCGQMIYIAGIKLSSPTIASAMGNLIPIYTFLLAIIFRLEKLDLRRSSSQAKSLGAIIAVTGAFIITLYKGPALLTTSSTSDSPHPLLLSQQSDWVIGGLLLALTCFLGSLWNIVQGITIKAYPDEITVVFFFTFFITIQATIISLILERNINAWKLRTGLEIAAIVSMGVFHSVSRIWVHTWCLRKKGPVYVAMFNPLGMAIALVMTVVFLGYSFYLGSAIGCIVIALGFYTVMWGQMKEKNMVVDNDEDCRLGSAGQKTPLLHNSEEII